MVYFWWKTVDYQTYQIVFKLKHNFERESKLKPCFGSFYSLPPANSPWIFHSILPLDYVSFT